MVELCYVIFVDDKVATDRAAMLIVNAHKFQDTHCGPCRKLNKQNKGSGVWC
jgi:hypothetical protein